LPIDFMTVPELEFQTILAPHAVCHAARRSMTNSNVSTLHTHDFHEFFWIDQGKGMHLVNGERRELCPGMLVAVAAEDVHGFSVAEGDVLRLVNVAFGRETWSYLLERYRPHLGDVFRRPSAERQFALSPGDAAELASAGREVVSGTLDLRAAERFLLNVLYLAERSETSEFPARAPGWLVAACRGIRDKKRFVKGTNAFVRLCGMSAEHVAREARRWLGKTPTEIVNGARLEWAATRLGETDQPIIEIALECGYGNLAHFYRLFRAEYRTSPAEYRRRQQRLLEPEPPR
jgi:AraC family cel operon transcriptional repressor